MRLLVCAAYLLLCFMNAGAQQNQDLPHTSYPYPAQWAPKPQELFLSYWTVEPGWSTELEVRNNVAWRDLVVTPVLRTAAGSEIALAPVTVPPEHVASIDLREALLTAAPDLLDRAGSFGSVVYRFSGPSEGNIFGASMVRRSDSPIGFHFDGEPVEKDWSPQSTDSIWWLPRATTSDYLILANASNQPLAGSLIISDAAGHSLKRAVALRAAETQRIDLRAAILAAQLSGTAGGVTVRVPEAGGNLITSHIVFDERTGLAATMKAFERDSAGKSAPRTMRAPMMALENPDPVLMFPPGTKLVPQLFLRNARGEAMQVRASVNWRSPAQSGSLPLPQITLLGGATQILNLSEAAIPPNAYWATIVLHYEGRRGDLVPLAASFDESGRYGLQTPFSEGVSHLWKGSMWHVDNAHNSLITAGNGGSETTHAAMTLFYNRGQSSYTIEKRLEPGEQIWTDISDIIRNQVPDKNGKTIPAGVTMGSYELRDLDHIGRGYLYEGKLVIDKSLGHGYYGCAGCCGYEGQKLLPNPFWGGVGTQGSNTAESEDMCSDSWVNVTSETYEWASTNAGIVNVASAVSHFMSGGTVTGSGQVQLQRQLARLECPVQGFEPQNTQTAQVPTASSIVETTQNNALSSGQSPCPAGYAGWIRVATKIVTDQNGSNIVAAGQSLQETITFPIPNGLGIGSKVTGTANTNAQGQFQDTYYVCSSVCPSSSASVTAQQTITDTFEGANYTLSPNSLVYKCSGITVNGN